MKEKILSVIVPLYNKEKLIRQCLDSFAREEFRETLEVLVIDDGSQDSSYAIAMEYQAKYPDVFRVIHKENGGVGSVMNLGFGCAKGKYVKEVDADDWVDSWALERLISYLGQNDVDIVLNPMCEVDAEGNRLNELYFKGVYFGRIYRIEDLINKVVFSIQRMTVRRGVLTENGMSLHESRYYVDMQIVGESVLHASTCAVLSDSLYRYRKEQEEQSVSLSNYIKHREDFYEQTILSYKRLRAMQQMSKNVDKMAYFRSGFIYYGLMLYAILLAGDAGDICKEFDTWLKAEDISIYEALGVYECVRYIRDTDKGTYVERRQAFMDKWETYAKQQNKPMELYDVAYIKTECGVEQTTGCFSRAEILFGLLDQWMMNRNQGMHIENYFVKNGFESIAIYGMGSLGNHLYAELESSEKIRVAYAIDKKGYSMFEKLAVKQPIDTLEKVDIVVVTLVRGYNEVISLLKEKLSCPVVLIEEVICES